MSQYLGEQQHGYWWLHCNNTLLFSKNKSEMSRYVIKTWMVKCELDWYRMMKEQSILKEGPLESIVA